MPEAQSWQKESFSLAYISAWAAQIGLTIWHPHVDIDAVDLTLRRDGLSVDVQLKCTSSPRVTTAGDFSYQLDNRAYEKLRTPRRTAVAYLALVTVPADAGTWLHATDEEILMRGCGYYVAMKGLPEPSGVETTVVHIPASQRINSKAFDQMFAEADEHLLYGALGRHR